MYIPFRTRAARRVSSLLPKFGLVPRPARPQGVSAIVRAMDEIGTIEASIESIKDLVEEIVAVDTGSTDGTAELLARLAGRIPNLKVLNCSSNLHWEFSNLAIENTNYRWILKWDSDFVSLPGKDRGISRIRAMALGLDQDMYYYINPTLIELAGDFRHQFPGLRLRTDIEMFTYCEAIRYVPVTRELKFPPLPFKLPSEYLPEKYRMRFEGLKLPFYYRILSFNEIAGFHVNVKPAIRHLLGYFHLQWLACGDFKKFPSLDSYALEHVRERWGFKDLDAAAEFYMKEFVSHLSAYDEKLGPLPENVLALAEKSPYKVIYRDGVPDGRLPGGGVK